ncbi:PASTA domain-containing protein, partial [Actinomycetota bacterium]
LYVSKGQQTFEMPDLIGLDLDSAEKILKKYELSPVDVFYEFSSSQPIDKIFDQYPVSKVITTKSITVNIYVSKGEDPEAVVPDVLTFTQEEALDILESLGFINITISEEESIKEMGKVFNQVPASGTVYNKESEIIIKSSKGIKVPDVIGKDKILAIKELENLGFIVLVYPDPDSLGKVSNQIPEGGGYLNYGSEVSIEIKTEESSIENQEEE